MFREIPLLVFMLLLPWGCTRASEPKNARALETQAKLRKTLTPEQYRITQENGTEEPFKNEYWDNHAEGIYVDVVSGKPLFSSLEKYDSKTGWPSFWKPLIAENILNKPETGLFDNRTEVRSKHADSHLGHVFTDGPPQSGLRYCINSAALRFIPADVLEKNGYAEFVPLFQKPAEKTNAFDQTESIVLAGGCFWGVQEVFKHVKGVMSATSGYSGGQLKDPTYAQVSAGASGHAESVKVVYDKSIIPLETLLKVFFEVAHDPTQLNKQGPDTGTQYRSAVFYSKAEHKQKVDSVISEIAKAKTFPNPIVTEVKPLAIFFKAEDYHQDYAERNPTQPYIVAHDLPKIEALRTKFPELFIKKPKP